MAAYRVARYRRPYAMRIAISNAHAYRFPDPGNHVRVAPNPWCHTGHNTHYMLRRLAARLLWV